MKKNSLQYAVILFLFTDITENIFFSPVLLCCYYIAFCQGFHTANITT